MGLNSRAAANVTVPLRPTPTRAAFGGRPAERVGPGGRFGEATGLARAGVVIATRRVA